MASIDILPRSHSDVIDSLHFGIEVGTQKDLKNQIKCAKRASKYEASAICLINKQLNSEFQFIISLWFQQT